MKKVVLLVMIVITSLGTVNAQSRNKRNVSTEQRIEQLMENLDKRLNLSDEQEQKIKAFYEAFFNQKISREQRKVQKAELDKNIESVLTDDQKKIFSEMKADTRQGKRCQR